ncbi:MAG: hypothetical protein EHJ95_04205 [Methanobacteriota archaeon]|nr:MAG: hypothetical protein EHJ95_04205 [Euryarchaeota archaeon]
MDRTGTSFFLCALLVTAAFVGCTGCTDGGRTLDTVRVAYLPLISNGPIFIAIDEGYFAEQGIEIELVKFQTGSMALPSLIQGDIDVSGGSVSPSFINAIATGAKVRIVADKGRSAAGYCNVTAHLVRRELIESGAVASVADLRGRRIAATSDQSYHTARALALGNLTPDDVELVDMTHAAMAAAFENGAIDAGLETEPYLTQILARGKAVVFLPAQDVVPDLPTPLYYGPSFTEKNPGLGKRFMVAYLKGVRQYNQGKTDQNVQIIGNYTHLDETVLRECCWVPIMKWLGDQETCDGLPGLAHGKRADRPDDHRRPDLRCQFHRVRGDETVNHGRDSRFTRLADFFLRYCLIHFLFSEEQDDAHHPDARIEGTFLRIQVLGRYRRNTP